ncbi:MAG: GFA family protein [Pseudomonadota bacterium]
MHEYSGSCLCGTVAYTIIGKADRFYHCHCRRCRKVTGAAHASNLLLPDVESAQFTRGADHVTFYKLPDAIRFSTCFCQTCGSKLPRILPALNLVVIPAGSLDHEPVESPQAHIFNDSRASWDCGAGDLPNFEAYPT